MENLYTFLVTLIPLCAKAALLRSKALAQIELAGGYGPCATRKYRPQLQYSTRDRGWHGACLCRVREEKKSMKTKLLALLFLVGSAAFAAPRVAIGVGVGGVGVGVGVGPGYGYYAPRPAYVAPAPVYWGPRAYYGCLLYTSPSPRDCS